MVIFPSTRSFTFSSIPLTVERRRKVSNVRKARRIKSYYCSILRIEPHKTLEWSHPTRPRFAPLPSEPANVKLTSTSGIREEGTHHLLIPINHYTTLSQHLPRLKFSPPYCPQEFATLSPIAFRAPVGDGECELSKKLKSMAKARKKRNLCITRTEVRERIDYERSR